MFKQDFTCPALLKDLIIALPVRGFHPLCRRFPTPSRFNNKTTGLVRVRSSLLTESRLMSFPLGTKIFQFPRFASDCSDTTTWWVSPFGYPRIIGCSHLPTAFRSVLRPSSPLYAKASSECSFALDCSILFSISPFTESGHFESSLS